VTVSDWKLLDERDFLRRSLEDAARENEAGDLSDEDYSVLRARDERRLEEVEAAIDAAGAPPTVPEVEPPPEVQVREPETGGRRRLVVWRRRWWIAAGGLALVVAGAVVLVVSLTTPRLPGQAATGTVDLNTAQKIEHQLADAQALVARGHSVEALALYGQVLTEDPRQPVALAEWGWLDWRAATTAHEQNIAAEGASAIVEAVRVDPRLDAAQYYMGTVLLQEGDPSKAVAHYARFLADHPSAGWLKHAAPEIRTAYRAAHRPVPPGLPGG